MHRQIIFISIGEAYWVFIFQIWCILLWLKVQSKLYSIGGDIIAIFHLLIFKEDLATMAVLQYKLHQEDITSVKQEKTK